MRLEAWSYSTFKGMCYLKAYVGQQASVPATTKTPKHCVGSVAHGFRRAVDASNVKASSKQQQSQKTETHNCTVPTNMNILIVCGEHPGSWKELHVMKQHVS